MVSLSAVEAMAAALWPQAISVAVSIPDQRKGERIVLLTTQKDADRGAMQRQAKASGASELAVPAAIQVVDKVPLLGSGKTDYVAATALAEEPPAARSGTWRDGGRPRTQSTPGRVRARRGSAARHRAAVAVLRNWNRRCSSAGFATLNLDYPSRKKPLDQLAEDIHPAVADFAGDMRAAPLRHPFDGRAAGAGLCGKLSAGAARPRRHAGHAERRQRGRRSACRIALYRAFFGPAGQQLTTHHDGDAASLPPLDYAVGIIAGNSSIDPISSF